MVIKVIKAKNNIHENVIFVFNVCPFICYKKMSPLFITFVVLLFMKLWSRENKRGYKGIIKL